MVKEELFRALVADSLELASLEGAGVDNWEGYEEASLPTEEEIDTFIEQAN